MFNRSSNRSVPPVGNGAGIYKDVIGLVKRGDNPQKSFQIRFNARSNLAVVLGSTRFNTNVNLEVLDSNQTVIAASRRLANRPEHLDLKQLAPGLYFLRAVLARGKQSRFRLRAQSTPIPDSGNLPSTARPVGLSPSPLTFSEFIGAEDVGDFYKFTVGGTGSPTGRLNLSLAGVNGNFLDGRVTLKIRDSNLNVVEQRTSGLTGLSLDETLVAGTYFVQVEPVSSQDQTNYQLTLAATAIADLAGNTPNAARSIEVNATPSLFQDFVGTGDQQDYYRFTVPENDFSFKLTGPSGNLLGGEVTVRLRDNLNNVLEQKVASGNGSGTEITKSLKAGTYVVQVSTSAKFVNYQFVTSAVPPKED